MSDPHGLGGIIGQQVAVRSLRKAVRDGWPAHAYAFVGPEGTGKLSTAIAFARALNCLDCRDGDSCGTCANCRALDHGNFPDVVIWSPEGKNTKIDQMRDMRDTASFAPLKGRWKVNIIEQGDTLNEESANCILKLLEEPPAYLVNILLYRSSSAMLPTIRSRCRIVRFGQASIGELAEQLVKQFGRTAEQAEFLAAFSQGRPGVAIRLMEDDDFFSRRERVISAAGQAAAEPWLALRLAEDLRGGSGGSADETDDEPEEEAAAPVGRPATPKPGRREDVLEALDILLSWYGDVLAARVRGPDASLVNSDKREQIRTESARYPNADPIASIIQAIVSTRNAIIGNANPQIATEALMIQLAGSKY